MSTRRLLHTVTRLQQQSSRLEWDGSHWIRRKKPASRSVPTAPNDLDPAVQKAREVVKEDLKKVQAAMDEKPPERQSRYVRGQRSETLKIRAAGELDGVIIPERPLAPESTDCCMSGCPRCVYDVYTEDLQLFHEALFKTRNDLRMKGVPVERWPEGIRPPPSQRAADKAASAESAFDRASEEVSQEIKGLDISLRTFLQFERELRRRRRAKQAQRTALEHVSQISNIGTTATAPP